MAAAPSYGYLVRTVVAQRDSALWAVQPKATGLKRLDNSLHIRAQRSSFVLMWDHGHAHQGGGDSETHLPIRRTLLLAAPPHGVIVALFMFRVPLNMCRVIGSPPSRAQRAHTVLHFWFVHYLQYISSPQSFHMRVTNVISLVTLGYGEMMSSSLVDGCGLLS